MSEQLKPAQRIWQTALAIPFGKVASYGQIADLAGLPGRARYVGQAMSLAPNDMNLPWHRVLRSSGEIAFPLNSEHAELQLHKLQEEGVVVINHRVKIKDFGWKPNLGEILSKLEF